MIDFKRISSFIVLPALAVASLQLAACEPKVDDEPNGNELAGDNSSCKDTATVLASVEEVSALGFSAAEILAVAEGEHSSPIFWHDAIQDGFIDVDFGPETGEGTLTVKITHGGGEIRFVDSEPEDDGFGDGFYGDCPDRLEIDVTAEISTSGGALAESVPVTLRATTTLLSNFHASLALDEIAGSFVAETQTPDATLGPAELSVDISSFGLRGSLSGMIEIDMGDVVGAGFISYASFPSEEPKCYEGQLAIPLDTALQGFSAADALALVNGDWIYQLTWQGMEPSDMQLTIEHDGDEICASVESTFDGQPGSISFGGIATLTTVGGVDASFPVVLSAEPDEMGNLAQVHVWNEAPYASLVESAAFAETYGEFGVDVGSYDLAGIEFAGAFAPSDQPGSADGSLTVLGGTDPNCSDVPGEPCEGIDVVELARAEWGNL
ncbi:MAG: hypothetical protein KC457_16150 [Myxococcales bacterium]|nr:hypothetical protein [Myxococcales bacterium]